MSTNAATDMKFMGETTHPGGPFRDLAVLGRARLEGDVTCRSFSCMGEARVMGALRSGKTSVMGQTAVAGPVDAGEFSVMGQMDCDSTLRVRKLTCMGQLAVKGQLDAETVRIFGQMTVQGDCNVDDFHSRGGFVIDGLLSVDNLLVRPHGPCRAEEIGGARIEVRRMGGILGRIALVAWIRGCLFGRSWSQLEVQTIEGDDIRLEDTVAKVVRGTKIQVGRGCRIALVEYRDSYVCAPDSEVGEARQIR